MGDENNIPVQETTIDRDHYGQQPARVAEGVTAEGVRVRAVIAQNNDAFTQSTEYRFEIGDQSASARVSPSGAITSVTNQNGMVRNPEAQTRGGELQRALEAAMADGRIEPHELNILASPTQSIARMPALRGRVSQTRGGQNF